MDSLVGSGGSIPAHFIEVSEVGLGDQPCLENGFLKLLLDSAHSRGFLRAVKRPPIIAEDDSYSDLLLSNGFH